MEIKNKEKLSKKKKPCVCKSTSSSRCVTQVFSEVAMFHLYISMYSVA